MTSDAVHQLYLVADLGAFVAKLMDCGERADCARLLLAAGAVVNMTNVQGVTPLHTIVRERFDVDLPRVLVDAGHAVDATTTDTLGLTPLDVMLEQRRPLGVEHVSVLLELGADPAAGVGRGPSLRRGSHGG